MTAVLRLLSIDPGQSTGLVVITKHQNFVLNEMTTVFEDQIGFALYLYPPTAVVIESAAHNGSRRQVVLVDRIRTLIRKECKLAIIRMITPGSWKPFSAAQGWNHPEAKTQHEMDAYNLARFFLLLQSKIDIEVIQKNG